jgi:hypothetical protein
MLKNDLQIMEGEKGEPFVCTFQLVLYTIRKTTNMIAHTNDISEVKSDQKLPMF